ncbi:lysine transporter LysE [Croceivirga radicis]|uniref:Lysine transporter LysE n=1 Tax=Croceivirga radicis TaxID=1929488 RepID=A0A1V6LPF2_9FLAO|nr:LysE family translocator [Croceivirga radicis]OQD42042.1 lysine transporter LysE [Croceivirga radicis]
MNIEILLAFAAATATLAIAPGPDNIFVLVQSITNGKKQGLAVVAGLMSGCLVHTTLLAFGISIIIRDNLYLFWMIKLFGAGYLLYLAYKVYQAKAEIVLDIKVNQTTSVWPLFKKGFWMNVLNPKVTIFFLAFFPGFLFSDTLSPYIQFYLLGFLFILVSSLIFCAIAILAGRVGAYLNSHAKAGFYLKWMQIVVFVGLAIYLVGTGK